MLEKQRFRPSFVRSRRRDREEGRQSIPARRRQYLGVRGATEVVGRIRIADVP
jgi:hypothetical protein